MMNSWLRHLPRMQKGGRTTNPLWISPDDAAARGLVEGSMVQVPNVNGALAAVVALADALLPSVVATSHGWGHRTHPGQSRVPHAPGRTLLFRLPSGPCSITYPSTTP